MFFYMITALYSLLKCYICEKLSDISCVWPEACWRFPFEMYSSLALLCSYNREGLLTVSVSTLTGISKLNPDNNGTNSLTRKEVFIPVYMSLRTHAGQTHLSEVRLTPNLRWQHATFHAGILPVHIKSNQTLLIMRFSNRVYQSTLQI